MSSSARISKSASANAEPGGATMTGLSFASQLPLAAPSKRPTLHVSIPVHTINPLNGQMGNSRIAAVIRRAT